MTYEVMVAHLKSECHHLEVKCPLECGASIKRGKWETHFDSECPLVKAVCSQCQVSLLKNEIASHNCIRDLKSKVVSLEKEMRALRLQNQEILEKLKEVLETQPRAGGVK